MDGLLSDGPRLVARWRVEERVSRVVDLVELFLGCWQRNRTIWYGRRGGDALDAMDGPYCGYMDGWYHIGLVIAAAPVVADHETECSWW